MSSLDQGITEFFTVKGSGATMDLEVQEDGMTRYVGKPDIEIVYDATPQEPTDQTNPFAIQGEVTPMTPGEFGQKVGATAAGAITGAGATAAGAPGDIAGVISGAMDAVTAPEGQKLEAFLTELARVSDQYGSEAMLQGIASVVNELPISDQAKQDFFAGSKYLGEWGEIPGFGLAAKTAVTAGRAGLKDLKQVLETSGKKAPMPSPVASPTAGRIDAEASVFRNPAVIEALPQRTVIDELDKAEWQQLKSDLALSQPISSAKDAVDAAKRNQALLATSGSEIAADLGIKFKDPGIKGSQDQGRRMAQKAKLKGGIQQLTDITRGGFAVNTVEQADQVVDSLLAKGFKIIDEGFTVTDLGYFDRKLMVVNPDGQVGEVQIWAEPLFKAKIEQGGQELYGIFRGKNPSEMSAAELKEYKATIKKYNIQGSTHDAIVSDAKEKSVQLYADALKEVDPSMRDIAVNELRRMVSEGGKEAETAQIMLERIGETADSMATQWQKGADTVSSNGVELKRGTDGVNAIVVDGKQVGDFSLDEMDQWVVNIDGRPGQITVDSVDEVMQQATKEIGKSADSMAMQWQKGADTVSANGVELKRGEGGVNSIVVDGKTVGDFSLDEMDQWVVNLEGRRGQITVDSVDEIMQQVSKEVGK